MMNKSIWTVVGGWPLVYASDIHGRTRERGVAAVEFAVILPILIILLTFPIFFGRTFMHYSVAQKAAQDAVRYMSSISLVEMKDQDRALAAEGIARQIASAEIAELSPGSGGHIFVGVTCDGYPCGADVPKQVTVNVSMRMFDDYFNNLTWLAVGPDGILLRAQVTMDYSGI